MSSIASTDTLSSYPALAIDWVAAQVYGHLPAERWQPLTYFSNLFILDEFEKTYSCVVEFHHDKHDRIDFSLGLRSGAAVISNQIAPPWWSLYIEKCNPLRETPDYSKTALSEEISLGTNLEAKDPQLSCILPDYHFWEFDCSGNSNKLAGIFQKVWKSTSCHPESLIERLEELLKIQGTSIKSNDCKKMLLDICSSLGCPTWIGFMIGREETLKLIFSLDFRHSDTPGTTFLQWFSHEFMMEYKRAASALESIDGIHVRPCLDVTLDRPQNYPRVCFEIFMTHPAKEAKDWKILERIADVFSLEPQLISNIKSTHISLPFGLKDTPFSHLFPDSKMPFKIIAANLCHFKICLIPRCPPKLKTYIHVSAKR